MRAERGQSPVRHRFREIDPARSQDVATISRLHLALLDWGPMARLAQLFLRRFPDTALVRHGLDRMRAVGDAPNRAALLFYHRLGGRFEPYERAGEPMIQVWLDIPRTPAPEAAPGTPVSRRGGG